MPRPRHRDTAFDSPRETTTLCRHAHKNAAPPRSRRLGHAPLIESRYATANTEPRLTEDGQYLMSPGDVGNGRMLGSDEPSSQPSRAPDPFSPRYHVSSSFSCALSGRSEEHTSELQSPCNLVCRLLLEKK